MPMIDPRLLAAALQQSIMLGQPPPPPPATFNQRFGDFAQPGGIDAYNKADNAIALVKGMVNQALKLKNQK